MTQQETRTGARPSPAGFGGHLRYWRANRNFTQLNLAHKAATTPRHISFMETGRSRPGETMVHRLASALAIPARDRNDFMLAAGYQGRFVESKIDSKTMEPFRRAIQYTVDAHQPFPSFAINRWYDILEKNKAADAMFGDESSLDADPDHEMNVIHSIFGDPKMRDRMENWSVVARAMACRLRREAALAPADQRMQELLHMAFEAIKDLPDPHEVPSDDLVICPTFRVGDQTVHTISMVARFGSSRDVFLDEIRVETIFPKDANAEAFFNMLENGNIPSRPCWHS